MTARESGIFSTVRAGIEAGGRPVGSDGLQTFGGVNALARYVKIGVLPPSGGSIVINEASLGWHLGQQKCTNVLYIPYSGMVLVSPLPLRRGGPCWSRMFTIDMYLWVVLLSLPGIKSQLHNMFDVGFLL